MTEFVITGKPTRVSREELRAILHASATVLEFHNKHALVPKVSVVLKAKVEGKNRLTGGGNAGSAFWTHDLARITLKASLRYDAMLTTVLHEVIHIWCGFTHWEKDMPRTCAPGDSEKLTSTLTAKLKPYVGALANLLVEDTYRRAAFIAHCKLSYRPTGPDHYDDAEDVDLDLDQPGEKFRKRGGKAVV